MIKPKLFNPSAEEITEAAKRLASESLSIDTPKKPADFDCYPWSSVFQKTQNEIVALNIMKILARKGNIFRPLTWEEYQTERQKDHNFSISEKKYFNEVIPYCESAEKAKSFSKYWN